MADLKPVQTTVRSSPLDADSEPDSPTQTPTPAFDLRPATLRDQHELSRVLASGFLDDDVFGRYIHPYRQSFPADFARWWRQVMREHLVDPSHRVFVTVDPQTKRITGLASWERQGALETPTQTETGKAEEKEVAGLSSIHRQARYGIVTRKLVHVQNYLSRRFHPAQSLDVAHLAIFEAEAPRFKHHWEGERTETWYLDFLCIDPEFQGRGCGKALIRERVPAASAEGVCLSVISSEIADAFYDKLGFVTVGSATTGALREVKGGNIKFMESHLKKDS